MDHRTNGGSNLLPGTPARTPRTPGTPGSNSRLARTPGTPGNVSRTSSGGGRTPVTPVTPSGRRQNGRVSIASMGSSSSSGNERGGPPPPPYGLSPVSPAGRSVISAVQSPSTRSYNSPSFSGGYNYVGRWVRKYVGAKNMTSLSRTNISIKRWSNIFSTFR
jgi:hypothetical protein